MASWIISFPQYPHYYYSRLKHLNTRLPHILDVEKDHILDMEKDHHLEILDMKDNHMDNLKVEMDKDHHLEILEIVKYLLLD